MDLGDSTFKLEVDIERDYHGDVTVRLKVDYSILLSQHGLMSWVDI